MQEKQSNESNNGRNYIILKKIFKMLKDIFRVKWGTPNETVALALPLK